jgi:hypothetical protein
VRPARSVSAPKAAPKRAKRWNTPPSLPRTGAQPRCTAPPGPRTGALRECTTPPSSRTGARRRCTAPSGPRTGAQRRCPAPPHFADRREAESRRQSLRAAVQRPVRNATRLCRFARRPGTPRQGSRRNFPRPLASAEQDREPFRPRLHSARSSGNSSRHFLHAATRVAVIRSDLQHAPKVARIPAGTFTGRKRSRGSPQAGSARCKRSRGFRQGDSASCDRSRGFPQRHAARRKGRRKSGRNVVSPGASLRPGGRVAVPLGTSFRPGGRNVVSPGTRLRPGGRSVVSPGTSLRPGGRAAVPPGTGSRPGGRTVLSPGTRSSPPGRDLVPSGTKPRRSGHIPEPSGKIAGRSRAQTPPTTASMNQYTAGKRGSPRSPGAARPAKARVLCSGKAPGPQCSVVGHHRSTVIPAKAGIQSGNDSRRLDPRVRGDDGGDSCALHPAVLKRRRGHGAQWSATTAQRPQCSVVGHHRSTVIPAKAGIQSGNDSRRLDPRLRGDDGGDSNAFSSSFVARRTIRSSPVRLRKKKGRLDLGLAGTPCRDDGWASVLCQTEQQPYRAQVDPQRRLAAYRLGLLWFGHSGRSHQVLSAHR